jgi:hypothetical protein
MKRSFRNLTVILAIMVMAGMGCATLSTTIDQIKNMGHMERATLAMSIWNAEWDTYEALLEAYRTKYKEGGFPTTVTADLESRKDNLIKSKKPIEQYKEFAKKYEEYKSKGIQMQIDEALVQKIIIYLQVRYSN